MNHHDLQLIEIGEKVGAEKERAAIVAWLRGLHWTHTHARAGDLFAGVFEAGEHRKD